MTLVRFRNSECFPNRVDTFGVGQLANLFYNGQGMDSRYGMVPPANILETADDFRIEMQVPGFAKEEIKIRVEDQVLTVSSEVVENEGNQDERFARREFEKSSFNRRFRLSNWVDTQNITAKYEQGVLVIQIPKREEIKSKPIMDITVS